MRINEYVKKFWHLIGAVSGIVLILISHTTSSYSKIIDEHLPHRTGLKVHDNILLHGGFSTRAVYDSNIFLSDTNEESDFIFYLIPSVGLEVPFAKHLFSAEYDLTSAFFTDHNELDYTDHRVTGLLEFNFTHHILTFSDVYRRFTDLPGQDLAGIIGTSIRESTNDFEAKLGAAYDELEYDVSYQNRYRHFVDGDHNTLFEQVLYSDRDYLMNILDGEIGYRVQSKTVVLAEIRGGHIGYDSDMNLVPDSYFIELLPGIKNESLKKTVIEFRVGPWWQDYGSSNFVRNDDHSDVVGRGSIEYSLDKKNIFRVSLERSVEETLYRDLNYNTTNFAGLDYTHTFKNEMMLILYVDYQERKYPFETTEGALTAKREDERVAVGAKLRWDIREWLSVEAGYEYHERDSNFPNFDYTGHQVTLRGSVGL